MRAINLGGITIAANVQRITFADRLFLHHEKLVDYSPIFCRISNPS